MPFLENYCCMDRSVSIFCDPGPPQTDNGIVQIPLNLKKKEKKIHIIEESVSVTDLYPFLLRIETIWGLILTFKTYIPHTLIPISRKKIPKQMLLMEKLSKNSHHKDVNFESPAELQHNFLWLYREHFSNDSWLPDASSFLIWFKL